MTVDVLYCRLRVLLLTRGVPHDPLVGRRQGGAATGGIGGHKEKERWAKAADDIRQHSSWASALRDPELSVFVARAFTWARAASCLQSDLIRLNYNPGF